MNDQAIEQLVFDIIKGQPKCTSDEHYFLSYAWASEDHKIGTHEFNKRQQNLYRYLIKHNSPESLFRARRKVLEKNPVMKARSVDPKAERTLLSGVSAVNPEYWQDAPEDNIIEPQQASLFIQEMKEKIG